MISRKEALVLNYIIKHVESEGYQPSLENIADVFEVSKKCIYATLKKLKQKGVIQFMGKRSIKIRGIQYVAEYRPPTQSSGET